MQIIVNSAQLLLYVLGTVQSQKFEKSEMWIWTAIKFTQTCCLSKKQEIFDERIFMQMVGVQTLTPVNNENSLRPHEKQLLSE